MRILRDESLWIQGLGVFGHNRLKIFQAAVSPPLYPSVDVYAYAYIVTIPSQTAPLVLHRGLAIRALGRRLKRLSRHEVADPLDVFGQTSQLLPVLLKHRYFLCAILQTLELELQGRRTQGAYLINAPVLVTPHGHHLMPLEIGEMTRYTGLGTPNDLLNMTDA